MPEAVTAGTLQACHIGEQIPCARYIPTDTAQFILSELEYNRAAAQDNLYHYSRNYLCTVPLEGMEDEWKEAANRLTSLEHAIAALKVDSEVVVKLRKTASDKTMEPLNVQNFGLQSFRAGIRHALHTLGMETRT